MYCNSHVPNANPHDPMPLKNNGKMNGAHKSSGHSTPDSRFDAGLQDMKIAHAMKSTQLTKPYPKITHGGAKYAVVSCHFNKHGCKYTHFKDYDDQTRLELVHRKVEDDLYAQFDEERQMELQRFNEETKVHFHIAF